jgi:hypothetical protein
VHSAAQYHVQPHQVADHAAWSWLDAQQSRLGALVQVLVKKHITDVWYDDPFNDSRSANKAEGY